MNDISQKAQPITMELIHQTADQLSSEGVKVTQQAVKDRIGGSFSTINKGLRSWRSEKNVIQHSENVTLPHDLETRFTTAIAQLWEQAQHLADDRLASERQALQNAQIAVTAELETMDDQLEQIEIELSTSQAELAATTQANTEFSKTIDELNRANVSQGTELQRQAEKLTAEREKSAVLQEKLDQLTRENSNLTASHATVQADLRHAQNEITRLNTALATLTETHYSTAAELNQKTAENANLMGKLETLEKQLTQAADQSTSQGGKINELLEKVTTLTAENAILTAQAKTNLPTKKTTKSPSAKIDKGSTGTIL